MALLLGVKESEEIVLHLPDGREVVLRKAPDYAGRRRVAITAPPDVRVSRRKLAPAPVPAGEPPPAGPS